MVQSRKQNKWLLTIDIGNTATSFAIFSLNTKTFHPKPVIVFSIQTKYLRNQLERKKIFQRINKKWKSIGAIVSSVVPDLNRPIKKISLQILKFNPKFVQADYCGRVKIKTKNPKEVGADRLVNARGAMALNHGPSIVVDFGTATTFDCVSVKGEYIGGVIAPGPVISSEALYQRTAKLPKVLLTKPKHALGKTTMDSIEAGLYHGYRGLVKEILSELIKQFKTRPKIFLTGGQAKWILRGLPPINYYVPNLTHLGLYLIWTDEHSKIY